MEMLFCSTVVGLPFLIPPMLLTGELFKAWNSCWQVTYNWKLLNIPPWYMPHMPHKPYTF